MNRATECGFTNRNGQILLVTALVMRLGHGIAHPIEQGGVFG